MLSQLDWMSETTKMAAYSKIDNLITNAGWPELVENDELLTEYYEDLQSQWKNEMTYTQMVEYKLIMD
jgi:predicted metalloendopeptidase